MALVGVAGAPPVREIAAAGALPRQRSVEEGQLGPQAITEQVQGLGAAAAGLAGLRSGLLVIGPEGDFTPGELEQLVSAGARPVGLGDLRLRAETAAIALLAYVRLQLGHSS